jgi:transposase
MDVHKDAMAVASVAQNHGAEVSSLGTIGTRQCDIDQRVREMQSTATPLIFVSEASPCGSWLSRSRTKNGYTCWVVAPSRIPHTPGDQVKTDRRDAVPWARLARSGERTAVDVPKVEEEALRDLSRARAEAISDLTDAPCRLKAVWRRHAIRSTGRANWGPAHLQWLSGVVCPTPTQPIVLPEDVRAVHEPPARLQRLAQARPEPVKAGRVSSVVEAWQAWRGGPLTVAVTLVAAMGALTRFAPPEH